MINVQVQGKTTNEVITHLEAMLKELRTGSAFAKGAAPENKMSKKAAAAKEIDEDEEHDEDEIEAGEDDAPTVKAKSKKKAAAIEEEEEDEDFSDDEDTDEDEEDSDEVSLKDARDAILALGKKKGSSVAKGVLSRFNLKSVAELDKKSSAKYYAPIVTKCKSLMKK